MRSVYPLSILFLFIFFSQVAWAQDLTGTVYDAQTRSPLVGVTILSADSSHLTTSDASGRFQLPDINLPIRLHYSFIGYQTQTLDVNTAEVRVYLEPANLSLNEVVVTGYENNRKLLETAGSVALPTQGNWSGSAIHHWCRPSIPYRASGWKSVLRLAIAFPSAVVPYVRLSGCAT
jgi:iron complex outermembrane recepter protein